MSGYPVVELIDRDRLLQVLNRSVVRARKAREEWRAAYAAHREACMCRWSDEECDDCENF